MASTARRLDRANGDWVDGNSLRVRVNCWRRLAEGVASSVMVGDPVVVVGRLYTRDWIDEDGQRRVMYEMEAVAVGHDLSGAGQFAGPAGIDQRVEDSAGDPRGRRETRADISGDSNDRDAEEASRRSIERSHLHGGGLIPNVASDDVDDGGRRPTRRGDELDDPSRQTRRGQARAVR